MAALFWLRGEKQWRYEKKTDGIEKYDPVDINNLPAEMYVR